MYHNLSSVTLYNLPIALTRLDNINWGIVNRDNYFKSIADQITFTDFTDLYDGREVLLPINSEIARDHYNYMRFHYENEVGVDKDYYFFVEDWLYISQEVCTPVQLMDTWTTFYNVLNNNQTYFASRLSCKAEKYHKVDGISAPKYKYTPINYDDKSYYAVLLNKSKKYPNARNTGTFNLMYNGRKIDEIPFEGIYVFCNRQGLNTIRREEYAEYIENVYSVVGEQISFCKAQVDSNNYVYYYNQSVNIGKVITIPIPSGYKGIMKRYPYFHVNIMEQIYDPVDFNNPEDIKFWQLAVPIGQGGISYIPVNYRGKELNRFNTTTIQLSTPVGNVANFTNSVAFQQQNAAIQHTKKWTKENTKLQKTINNKDTVYQKSKSTEDYNNELFNQKVSDRTAFYNIPTPLGSLGALYAGGSALKGLPIIGGIFGALQDIVNDVSDAVGEEMNIIDGIDYRATMEEKYKKEQEYLDKRKATKDEVLDYEQKVALIETGIQENLLSSQAGYTIPAGELSLLSNKNKAQIVEIDPEYLGVVRNYYDMYAHEIAEYKQMNVTKYNYGKYYDYMQINLISIPDALKEVTAALTDIFSSGIRLWKSTDPNIFKNYKIDNEEV